MISAARRSRKIATAQNATMRNGIAIMNRIAIAKPKLVMPCNASLQVGHADAWAGIPSTISAEKQARVSLANFFIRFLCVHSWSSLNTSPKRKRVVPQAAKNSLALRACIAAELRPFERYCPIHNTVAASDSKSDPSLQRTARLGKPIWPFFCVFGTDSYIRKPTSAG